MRPTLLALVSLLLCCFPAAAAPTPATIALRYEITPEYDGDSVRALEFTLTTQLPASGELPLVIPSHWAAASNLWDNIDNVSTTPNAAVFRKLDEGRAVITGPPLSTVQLYYRVSQRWTGPIVRATYFKPIFTQSYFLVAGAGALIYPELQQRSATVAIEWHARSNSFVADCFSNQVQRQPVDEGQLQNCIFYGGAFDQATAQLPDGTVHVYRQGSWPFSLDAFSSRLSKIVEYERRFWRERHMPPYGVVLIPTDEPNGNFGGTAFTNLFVLYVPRGAPIGEGINHLFVHEYFHNWNPRRLFTLAEPESREYWFSEGFTEYYAYKFLRDLRLTDPYSYLQELNARVRSLWLSPNATLPNDQIAARYFEPQITPVDYLRGEILALRWNTAITRTHKNQSLDDAFRTIASHKHTTPADTQSIARTFSRFAGPQTVRDVEQTVTRGALPQVPAPAFAPCATLQQETIDEFDPGFDLRASGLSGVLKGVRPDGPAYRAGLRNGESFTRKPVSPIALLPLEIHVHDATGERLVRYLPKGAAHVIPQYVAIMPVSRFNECFEHLENWTS